MKEIVIFMVDVAVEVWRAFERGALNDAEIAEMAADRVKLEVQRKLASARFEAKLKRSGV
jgi:hypothetical protein